jgi:hypothetical protein
VTQNMRNCFSLTATLVILALTDGKVIAAPIIDQSFTAGAGLSVFLGDDWRAETYTAQLTGTLAGINVDVEPGTVSAPLTILLTTVSAGIPTTTVLGTTTLNSNSIPDFATLIWPTLILSVGPPPFPRFRDCMERSSPSRVRFAALCLRALDGSGPFRETSR